MSNTKVALPKKLREARTFRRIKARLGVGSGGRFVKLHDSELIGGNEISPWDLGAHADVATEEGWGGQAGRFGEGGWVTGRGLRGGE